MPTVPCNGGTKATLQVNNTDCSCISIDRIVNNGNSTFTIFLSNGQSMSFTIPAGAAGTIAMRVFEDTVIQWQANGGTWTDLIALSELVGPAGADGNSMFWNTMTPVPNAGNSGFETVYTGVVPANKLSVNGYGVTVFALFSTPSPHGDATQEVKILFGGQEITPDIAFFNITDAVIGIEVRVVRTSASAAKYVMTSYVADALNNGVISQQNVLAGFTISGLDYTVDIDVEMQISSTVIGDVNMQASSGIYNKTL